MVWTEDIVEMGLLLSARLVKAETWLDGGCAINKRLRVVAMRWRHGVWNPCDGVAMVGGAVGAKCRCDLRLAPKMKSCRGGI